MNIIQDFGNATYVIKAYEAGVVVVNDTAFRHSIIIMPEYLDTTWEPQQLDEVTEEHLAKIIDLKPEVVLFGTGFRYQFPGVALQAYFLQHGVGIEFMDTSAACRTYNILMSEGRNVAGALLLAAR